MISRISRKITGIRARSTCEFAPKISTCHFLHTYAEVDLGNGVVQIPALWLRDVSEWQRHTLQRAVNMAAVPSDLGITSCTVNRERDVLQVTWSTSQGTAVPPPTTSADVDCPVLTRVSQLSKVPPHARGVVGAATSWAADGTLRTEFSLPWLRKHAPGSMTADAAWAAVHQPVPQAEWAASAWPTAQPSDSAVPDVPHASWQPFVAPGHGQHVWLPAVQYSDAMSSPEGLRDWLSLLARHGFGIVSGVPATEAATEALCRRVTWPRPSMYSAGMWRTEVRPAEASQDTAYTADALPLHTDGTYFEAAPGVQVFHATAAADSSGYSILADAFAIARHLAVTHPDAHAWLTTNAVPFQYCDSERTYLAHHVPIQLAASGDMYVDFHYNALDRAALVPPAGEPNPAQWVQAGYEAVQALERAMADPAFHLQFLLQPGTVLAFDNRRVLHGRTAFTLTSGRTLVGCYMDQEEVHSRLVATTAACS